MNLKHPNKSHIRITIEKASKLAYERGGLCLSTQYTPGVKLQWKCIDGHIFYSKYESILVGKWCPHCNINYGEEFCRLHFEWIFDKKFIKCRPDFLINPTTKAKLELDGYCAELGLAFEHHGRQHYEELFHLHNESFSYRNKMDFLKIELCKMNNVKLIIIPDIFNITKAENCLNLIYLELEKLGFNFDKKEYDLHSFLREVRLPSSKLNKLKEFCSKLGGDCLSNVYLGGQIKIQFTCKNNHIWLSTPVNILKGKWCKQCSLIMDADGSKFLNLKKIVESKNGLLLEDSYLGSITPHKIQCSEGHIWKTSPTSIKSSWCHECLRLSLVKNLLDVKEHIKNNNGHLLTDESTIKNSKDKISIECSNGHLWVVEINSLRYRKHWCRLCVLESRRLKKKT